MKFLENIPIIIFKLLLHLLNFMVPGYPDDGDNTEEDNLEIEYKMYINE